MQLLENHIIRVRKWGQRGVVRILNTFGVICDIYLPISEDNVYKNEDSKITYAATPDHADKRCLITGLSKRTSKALEILDPFYEEGVYFYDIDTSNSNNWPNGTLLKVYIEERELYLKIDSMVQAIGGTNTIIRKYKMVPGV